MSVLRSRLYALAQRRQREKIAEFQGEKKDIAWGHQIRSYTLAPYQLVKDHRTGVEVGNVDAVFDGGLIRLLKLICWGNGRQARARSAARKRAEA